MRSVTVAAGAAVLAMLLLSPFSAEAAARQYVQITEPFVNVYERLDPKSSVILTAPKGKRFDLIYAGPLWYQVKVQDQIGWIERKAGRVVEGRNILSTVLSITLLIALLAGTLYFVFSYIKKQKAV
jgi:hypothetical protein